MGAYQDATPMGAAIVIRGCGSLADAAMRDERMEERDDDPGAEMGAPA